MQAATHPERQAARITSAGASEKARLDAATFAGVFAPKRAKSTLVTHTGLVHGDIDHIADVPVTKHRLCGDVHVAYCFTSPSNAGVKLGVSCPPVADDAAYKAAWQAAEIISPTSIM
jgi:hypothetical protein